MRSHLVSAARGADGAGQSWGRAGNDLAGAATQSARNAGLPAIGASKPRPASRVGCSRAIKYLGAGAARSAAQPRVAASAGVRGKARARVLCALLLRAARCALRRSGSCVVAVGAGVAVSRQRSLCHTPSLLLRVADGRCRSIDCAVSYGAVYRSATARPSKKLLLLPRPHLLQPPSGVCASSSFFTCSPDDNLTLYPPLPSPPCLLNTTNNRPQA